MRTPPRAALRIAGIASCAAALVTASLGTAHAHVGVNADNTAAGAHAVLTFGVAHGCDGSPTTKIAIKIPDGINAVAPTVNPGWTVTKVTQKLSSPVTDEDGDTVTSRVDRVVYTAKAPLPDGIRDTFALQLELPHEAAGKTLALPTIQTCVKGETAWVDLAADGQDAEELEAPAPTITVTEGGSDDHHAAPSDPAGAAHAPAADAAVASVDGGGLSSGTTLGLAGLVAGLAGLGAGSVALARVRQHSK